MYQTQTHALPFLFLNSHQYFPYGTRAATLKKNSRCTRKCSAGNVIARMIQGLGYRYYWASKDLRTEDLSYRPSKASSSFETLEHIYGLAEAIRNTATSSPSIRPVNNPPKDYILLRKKTLEYLEQSSALFLNKTAEELEQMQVIFQRGTEQFSFPIWNLINGPISDALYHTGQVVSFRRTSGNPIQKRSECLYR